MIESLHLSLRFYPTKTDRNYETPKRLEVEIFKNINHTR